MAKLERKYIVAIATIFRELCGAASMGTLSVHADTAQVSDYRV
jgi:hypothetical protein